MSQLTMDNKLFEKERGSLNFMDSLGKLVRKLKYLKVIIETTAGNYDYKSRYHTALVKSATALSYGLHWIALMQYRTGNTLTDFVDYPVGHYTEGVVTERVFTKDNIMTPHALYEVYLRSFRDIEATIKANQPTVDRIKPCNDLVGYLYDSMQDAGAAIEEIV